MAFTSDNRKSSNGEFPPEVYASLVDSLFTDARSLALGSLAAFLTVLIAATRSGEPILFLFAAGAVVVAVLRGLDFWAYSRVREGTLDPKTLRVWEIRYVRGAAAHVALLGLFCLAVFAVTDDPFVRLFSFSLTIAYLIGISGRNFSSSRLVFGQIIGAGVPMMLALLLEGELYFVIFAVVLVPFFLSLWLISARLRRMLLNAATTARDNQDLAERLDTALTNMPQGLAMFDADGHAVVVNERFQQLLRLPYSSDEAIGRSLPELLYAAAKAGTMMQVDATRIAIELRSAPGGTLQLTCSEKLTLAFTLRNMEQGGFLVVIEDITERQQAAVKISQLARFDQLTGLPNRTYFHDQTDLALAAARINERACALLFIDLDDFKQINDTLGHPTGDRLLCAVADRLRGLVGPSEVIARFGGDEFVILQPISERGDAARLAAPVSQALSEPYELDAYQAVIGASVGIALAPEHGGDADRLLRAADMALYRAKADAKGRWHFFEPEMDEQAKARRDLEQDFRTAVAQERLQVYYQPLYNLHTKRFSSCEALLRWPDPHRGMVPPSEFIPIAEDTGLIGEISAWVLRQACAECLRWPPDVRVSVNLSPIQFRRGDVVKSVQEALAHSGLPPERLELEITETVLLLDDHSTRDVLYRLRDLGIRLDLDDFGTGYSSLSYLQSFPLDKVKIDRSFLRGLGASDRTLVLLRGVTALSSQLGMSVAVEGIETEEQLRLVSLCGDVDEVQGFLFSKPVPARKIRELLEEDQRTARVA